MRIENDVLSRAIEWASRETNVRSLILESSRTNPHAQIDALSDFDILLVVSDSEQFVRDDSWITWYGSPMVKLRTNKDSEGFKVFTRLVLYEDGTKVDHSVWPVAFFQQEVAAPTLPALLDMGYEVLLDKDGLTQGLPAPTYSIHIPPKPSGEEFLSLIEEFWWETIYVAKNLWRGDLFQLKYPLDVVIKFDLLRRMLEWHIESQNDWQIVPGRLGRNMRRLLRPDLWEQVQNTFVGDGIDENWDALERTGTVFRQAAQEVGLYFGYRYPEALENSVRAYWAHVRSLPK